MVQKYLIEKRFSSFFKPRGKDRIARLLAYAGIETNPDIWVGSRMLIILLVGIIGALLPFSLFPLLDLSAYPFLSSGSLASRIVVSFACGAGFAAIAAILIYMHLYYLITERTQRVEKVLPDFLLMVAANLRSGMTPFAAFQASARPEFGPLQSEILYVSSRSLGSESFSDALRELTATIDSPILRRMIIFFENGLKSGGRLAYLLETSAEEIRESEEMKRQMIISTKTYAIFVVFILVFGLPLLLAISTQFLSIFAKIQANIGSSSASTSMIGGLVAPKTKLDTGFIDQMTYVIITGTSILTAVLVGVIAEGRTLYGLKYFPPLALAATVMFWIFKAIISSFVGTLV
ncbi:MAG: type II secretion system F family protein [Candidatus Micrarchaeota archaeon]|nr:type II secretion system F family protein [Candidatus Micrarchaeota archaeon]